MAIQVKMSIQQILSFIGKLGNLLKTELSQRQWVQHIRSLLRFEVRRQLEQVMLREQLVKSPKMALMLQQEIQSKIKQVSWIRQEKLLLIIQNQALLMILSQQQHGLIERLIVNHHIGIFEDYGSHERVAYLKDKLYIPDSVSCNPVRGDFTYYVPWGNIAVFTKDFRTSQSLYRFGKLSEELLEAIANRGQETVTISLIE